MTLSEAVDAVTLPIVTKIIKDDGTLHEVRRECLLEQIENAVVSSPMGDGGGGGGSSPTTVNMIDSAAFDEREHIRRTINGWRAEVGLPRIGDMVHGLTDWHRVFILTDKDPYFYAEEIQQWPGKIARTISPPKRLEIVTPCVACEATHYETPDGATHPNPVELVYPRDLAGLDEVVARCRACDWEAAGEMNLRGFRFEIDSQTSSEEVSG